MPAETAAATGATEANQSNQNGADVPSQGQPAGGTQEQQSPHSEPIGDRAAELEMLDLLDVPAEVLDRVRQSAEKDAEEQGKKESEQEQEHEHDHEREKADDATWPDSARTRVGKLTAKREELKGQLSEKEAEIARLKALVEQPGQQAQPQQQAAAKAPLAAHDGNPYAAVTNEAEIAERVRVAREVRDWALMNLEGADEVPLSADANGEVKTKDFTAREVRKMLVDANHALEIHLPGRLQQLRQDREMESQRQQAEAARPRWEEIGMEDHPDLANPESALSKHVGQLLEAYPMLKGAPDGRVVAADIVAASLKRAERLADAGLIAAPAGTRRPGTASPATTASQASPVDPKLQPFLAPKPLRAPAVPSSAHGAPPPPSTDADATKAREDYLNSSRSEDDHERFVNSLSEIQARNGSGGVTPARV